MSLADFRSDFCEHEAHGDVVVVTVTSPRLSEELNLEEFAEQLFTYVDHYDFQKVVLCCEQVSYACSGALGKLITLHRRLNREQGRLILCGFQPTLKDTLVASRLFDYFETAETRGDALEMFQAESDEA